MGCGLCCGCVFKCFYYKIVIYCLDEYVGCVFFYVCFVNYDSLLFCAL